MDIKLTLDKATNVVRNTKFNKKNSKVFFDLFSQRVQIKSALSDLSTLNCSVNTKVIGGISFNGLDNTFCYFSTDSGVDVCMVLKEVYRTITDVKFLSCDKILLGPHQIPLQVMGEFKARLIYCGTSVN